MALEKIFKVRKGLIVNGSGSTIVDVQGSQGQLFSVSDNLDNSLFTINDVSGVPVFEVFSNDTVKIGTYNNEGIIVEENNVTVGNKLTVVGDISASSNLYLDNSLYDKNNLSGSSEQVLFSIDGGVEWRDNNALTAQDLVITGKNLSGGEIQKGTPLYFTGSGTSGNTVGIYPADAGNLNRMPAGGVAGETIQNGEEGSVYIYGFINGVNTSQFNAGDDVFVAVGGGYTNIKPTGSALIQKLGNVEKVSNNNGSGVIQGPSWYNDLPNWEEGKVKVGKSDGQPVTSSVIHLDETNGRLGVNTTTPSQPLTVQGNISGSSNLDIDGNTTLDGNLTVNGNTTLGNAGADTLRIYSSDVELNKGSAGSDHTIKNTNNQSNLVLETTKNIVINPTNFVGIKTTSPSKTLTVDGDISSSGIWFLENGQDKYITTNEYSPDFGGFGARLETGISGSEDLTAKLTVDDLVVRKRLSVYELLINQIRATNGSLFVSSVGRIYSASYNGVVSGYGVYTLFFDTGSAGSRFAHGFRGGDLILAQRIDPTITNNPTYVDSRPQQVVYRSEMQVQDYLTSGSVTAYLIDGDPPQEGFDYVRIGNVITNDRKGTVYLTADDQNAPYIDVVDGVASHNDWFDSSKVKVRMGKLDGITDSLSSFGNLSGYGFWASGSAYLEGGINATFGEIGGFGITQTTISSSNNNLVLRSNGEITGSNVLLDGGLIGGFSITDKVIQSIRTDASEYISEITNDSGTNYSSVNTNEIYDQFKFEPTTVVSSLDSGKEGVLYGFDQVDRDLVLNANGDITGSKVLFKGGKITGSNSSFVIEVDDFTAKGQNVEISGSNFHLLNGNITASNVDLSGKITATSGSIGGWDITSNSIQKEEIISEVHGTKKVAGMYFPVNDTDVVFQAGQKGNTPTSVPPFAVKFNGDITGSQVQFTGGKIGGFTIDTTSIKDSVDGDTLILRSSGDITGSQVYFDGGRIGGFSIGTNVIQSTNNDLRLESDGTISGSNVFFDGGTIGGWDITQTSLENTTSFGIGVGTPYNVGIYSGNSINDVIFKAGIKDSEAFKVTYAGNLTATNVDLTGKITAQTGKIGGFEITEDAITGSNFYLSGSATGNDYFISSSNFNVKANGNLTGSQVLLTGGKISGSSLEIDVEGVNIKSDRLLIRSGDFTTIDRIVLGEHPNYPNNGPEDISLNTGKGFFANESGSVRIGDQINYLKFDAGSSLLDIDIENFSLNTSDLKLNSTTGLSLKALPIAVIPGTELIPNVVEWYDSSNDNALVSLIGKDDSSFSVNQYDSVNDLTIETLYVRFDEGTRLTKKLEIYNVDGSEVIIKAKLHDDENDVDDFEFYVDNSGFVKCKIPASAGSAPSSPNTPTVCDSGLSVLVEWNVVTGADYYKVERYNGSTATWTTLSNQVYTNSYRDTVPAQNPFTAFKYKVSATNTYGTSNASNSSALEEIGNLTDCT